MRKILYLAVVVSAVAFVGWSVSTQAVDNSFAERFVAAHKVQGETGTYAFDKNHSFIGFKAKHMGLIEVPGFFRDFTGELIDMPSGYDEFTERASPNYTGGTEKQRANRDMLRKLMEDVGFTVNPNEWWHFDYKNWQDYAIYDIAFSEVGKD